MRYFQLDLLLKGRKESIIVKAENREEALHLAKLKKGGVIIRVQETTPPLEERLKDIQNKILSYFKQKKVKPDSLIASVRQLAVMTNAGIPIYDALKEIANSTVDKTLQEILHQIAEDINSGLSLSESVENFRYQLGSLTVTMIKLGEQTGNMPEALFTLANILEEIRENILKFKKAIRYPLITLTAMAIAFVVLIMFVVPKFKAIFERFHAELPLPTRILLWLEHAFSTYGIQILVGLIIIVFVIIYLYRNNESIKYNIDKYLLKVYLIKDIIYYATLSRFTLVFTELVAAGIPVAEALDSAVAMVDNSFIKEKLETVKVYVERGVSLTDSFKETELFENMIIQMIGAGESSGQLDAMMRKVSDYYRMKFNYILDNMSSYLEPILLTIIAALVLLLALGIFLPMWDMAKAVKGH
ncbi:type II secretion system F family protein [Nitrosophilus kaiyonis]|uniref:type II secretion system F family protein n=1 Tax=Nitrosophilus kaiyonis TaxID=2930200 RepID=UPI002492F186|nr:type II secretion system F family protein [Nitrosophilus kaiyonis]